MKPTSPADLNTRLELQAPVAGTWITIATVWAKETAHRSNEAVQAMAASGVLTLNERIRYRTDVKSTWKIKRGNKFLAIIGPPVKVFDGSQVWLDITVRETG